MVFVQSRILPLAAAALVALPTLSAAQSSQTYQDGDLGGSVTYQLSGPAGQLYVHLPSFQNGPLPLALFFPGSPLVLGIGIDLLSFAQIGFLTGGTDPVVYPLPSIPAAVGIPLNAQFLALNLAAQPQSISNKVTFSLGFANTSHFVIGTPVPGLQPASVLTARQGHDATTLNDGRVLVTGGEVPDSDDPATSNLTALNTTEIFDPNTETYTAGPNLTQARSTQNATLLSDGRVLLSGGFADSATGLASATAEVYDPVANTFTPTGPMNFGRTQHTSTLLNDGRVFATGGANQFDLSAAGLIPSLSTATATTEIYDPNTNSWTAGPSFDLPIVTHAATLLPSGKVLIAGGAEIQTVFGQPVPVFSNRARLYDPVANTITEATPLPVSAASPGPQGEVGAAFPALTTLSTGQALFAGGAFGQLVTLTFFTLTSTYVYDEPGNSWTTTGVLNQARANGTLLESGGTVTIIGGLNAVDVVTGINTPASAIEQTDTTAATWTAAGASQLPREVAISVLVNAGTRILTVGVGINGTGGTANDTVDRSSEYYTP